MTPESFRTDLKRFDKRLDFIFNPREAQWEVVGYDKKNIKYLIKPIPIGQIDTLGPWVLQDLYEMSPMKQGGAKALNRKLDAAIEAEEKRNERDTKTMLEGLHDEAYTHFAHGEGTRLSFATTERCKDFVINDRRRLQENTVSA